MSLSKAFNITSTITGSSISINEPDVNPSNWMIIKEDVFKPDKDLYIYEEFIKDHSNLQKAITVYQPIPNQTKVDYETTSSKIYALASRSQSLNIWLARKNLGYAQNANVPTFYSDKTTPQQYAQLQKTLVGLSEIEQTRAEKLNELATNYKLEIARTEAQFDEKAKNFTNSDSSIANQVKILNLNTTSLPLTLQLAIENYTPAASTGSTPVAPTKKQYARELLISYKRALLDVVKAKTTVDITAVIDELSLK